MAIYGEVCRMAKYLFTRQQLEKQQSYARMFLKMAPYARSKKIKTVRYGLALITATWSGGIKTASNLYFSISLRLSSPVYMLITKITYGYALITMVYSGSVIPGRLNLIILPRL